MFPLQSTLPIPTSIRFNNELVCSSDASIYLDADHTMINLQFTLETPEQPLQQLTFGQTQPPAVVKTSKRQRHSMITRSTTTAAPDEYE
jgi:hypothetical protein